MANKPSKDERPFEFLETPVASSSPARMWRSLAMRQMALVATGPEDDLGPTQRLALFPSPDQTRCELVAT